MRAGRGRDSQGRDLSERRQGSAAQVHRQLRDGTSDHNVINMFVSSIVIPTTWSQL